MEARAPLEELPPDLVVFARPDHFEGDVNVLTVIVTLTTATIPVVTKVILERIRSRRHIRVKLKGMEITGAELADVEKLLRSLKSD
jgi:hypothetical protein